MERVIKNLIRNIEHITVPFKPNGERNYFWVEEEYTLSTYKDYFLYADLFVEVFWEEEEATYELPGSTQITSVDVEISNIEIYTKNGETVVMPSKYWEEIEKIIINNLKIE